VPRFIFVVARHLPAVYEHLRKQFAAEADVDVVVDRRRGERRHGGDRMTAPDRERRQRDRRRNAAADEGLRTMGYAFVRAD
jgi:hypothetical protein